MFSFNFFFSLFFCKQNENTQNDWVKQILNTSHRFSKQWMLKHECSCVFLFTAFWTFVARESTNWQISIYLLCVCARPLFLYHDDDDVVVDFVVRADVALFFHCVDFGDKNLTSIYFQQKSLPFTYTHADIKNVHTRSFSLC